MISIVLNRSFVIISEYGYIWISNFNDMSDKDIEMLIDLAKQKLAEAKLMTKKEAILSLNRAGILTKKGKFMKPYSVLEKN
jgi:hypothetical protein